MEDRIFGKMSNYNGAVFFGGVSITVDAENPDDAEEKIREKVKKLLKKGIPDEKVREWFTQCIEVEDIVDWGDEEDSEFERDIKKDETNGE